MDVGRAFNDDANFRGGIALLHGAWCFHLYFTDDAVQASAMVQSGIHRIFQKYATPCTDILLVQCIALRHSCWYQRMDE